MFHPRRNRGRRRGTILPLLALTLVTLIGFLALAIDVGMLAIARTQAQQAADVAALTAARTLNGYTTTNYNQTAATANAQNILTYNAILGQAISPTQLQLTYGSYDYNQTSQVFAANYPAAAGRPYTAVTSVVTSKTLPAAFSSIFGTQLLPSVSATAQAVHRPRDIALVMDYSGSMRTGTELGFDFVTATRATNNPDTLFPTYAQYAGNSAMMQGPSTTRTSSNGNVVTPSNTTTGNPTYSLTFVNSFYQNAAYASPLIRAFDSYTSGDGGATWSPPTSGTPQLPPSSYASLPGGDVPPFVTGGSASYAKTVLDATGSATTNILWELDGYAAYPAGRLDSSGQNSCPQVWYQSDYSTAISQFNGYSQGPGYYGKTFFMWPPDPRAGAITSATAVKTYLLALGVYAADAVTLSNNWAAYQAQGITAGGASLQGWLISNGYASARYVPGSNSKAPIFFAVQRLFNRGYPAGASNGAFVGDWRLRFFGTNDNTKLFNLLTGQLNPPSAATYTINYNAILQWIAQSPNPFPTQMRAGRIKYYGSIPTAITGSWPSYGSSDQQFWVRVIDYTLGFWQQTAGVYTDVSGYVGYGPDITWGTNVITPPPVAPQSVGYLDNPDRPLLRYWFGPINMADSMHNDNFSHQHLANYPWIQPGDSYEAPSYVAKQGFAAAINTMQSNHPNDWVTLVPYTEARSSATDLGGRFNCVRSPLGTNYAYASAALLFPFSTINADGSSNGTEIGPFGTDPVTGLTPSADFLDTPRGSGSTTFAMALMLCYNQFAVTAPTDGTLRNFVSSTPITFPSGMAGGLGRKGAQKVVIFETDGLADCSATASLVSAGTYSYYKIRYDMNNPTSGEYPSNYATSVNDPGVLSQINSLVQQLATDYGTTRNPFRLYTIAFGPVFSGTQASSGLATLQNMQYYAGTQTSPTTALPASQVITGTDAQMSAALTSTYTSILQNGVQIALIQ